VSRIHDSCHSGARTRGPDKDFTYQRSTSIPESTLDNRPSVDVQPRAEPSSWMSAITAQINALWRTVHGRLIAIVSTIKMLDRNHVECVEEVRLSQQNFTEEERYVNRQDSETARIPERKLWRLESNTEIELDKVYGKKPNLSPLVQKWFKDIF